MFQNPTSVIPRDHPSAEQLRLIDLSEVMSLTGMGRTSINDKVRDPASTFPKPVRFMRHNRWVLGEVLSYISSLIESRNAALEGVQ